MMDDLPLRDIHVPPALSFWPLAPGWIALAVLILLLIVLGFWWFKHLKQLKTLKNARKMLVTIKQQSDPLQCLAALSILLRRVAMTTKQRTDVASLSGEAWLAYLDNSFPDSPFTLGVGRCLADSQYRKSPPDNIDMEQLFKLCELWLAKQKPAKTPPLFTLPGKLKVKL